MLHILFLILKIIGIILAVLLGLVLLLICIVLFVPVRYKANVQKAGEKIVGRVRVSWLFHGVTVTLDYRDKKMDTVIRVLGINLQWLKEIFPKKGKEPEVIEKKTAEESMSGTGDIQDTGSSVRISANDSELTKIKKEASEHKISGEQSEIDDGMNRKTSELTNYNKDVGTRKKTFVLIPLAFRKIVGIIRFIFSIPAKITGIIRKISLTIKNICAKINYWKTFLDDKRTKAALSCIKDRLIRILKHVLPRRLKGELRYGFEDPCTTGQVLAGICMFYPVYQKHINIYPDFENEVLEGHLDLKGRIHIGVLLWHALIIFIDKNFKFVLNILLHKEEL